MGANLRNAIAGNFDSFGISYFSDLYIETPHKKKPPLSRGLLNSNSALALPAREHREQQQRHDVGDFDHRVYGGAGCVFVRVADGVACDRRFVRF